MTARPAPPPLRVCGSETLPGTADAAAKRQAAQGLLATARGMGFQGPAEWQEQMTDDGGRLTITCTVWHDTATMDAYYEGRLA